MKTNRAAYGEVLNQLARENPLLTVVDADLMSVVGYDAFRTEHPQRLFEVGIAEQNMVGIAAGLATCGFTAFAASFAVFLVTRALDQVRNMVCYNNLNVKLIGTHAGLETGQDGGTHMSVEDVAIMKAMPNMRVLAPSTPLMTQALTRFVSQSHGPYYLRLGREPSPEFYTPDDRFVPGESKELLSGEDITLMAYGRMVSYALEAAQALAREGIRARVIDMYSLKPLDEKAVLNASEQTGCIITIEDHSVIGGLGESVAAITAEKAPCLVRRIGIADRFGRSGSWKDVYAWAGLSVQTIVSAALEVARLTANP